MLTWNRRAALIGAFACAAFAAACGGGDDEQTTSVPKETGQGQARFDPAAFGGSVRDANKWFPLKPGTQIVKLGHVNRGHRRLTHRIVYTITDVSKKVDGVQTVAALDQDIDAGQVAEQALDFLAEDRHGNVWTLGSYTEAYEGGQFVNAADAWLSGAKGAEPGLAMQAKPRSGTPPYIQAKVPGDDPDVAQVVKTGQSNCVPYKCFKDVIIIHEGTDAGEWKYYAPGVGGIRTEPRYKGGEQEVEELINFTQLSPRALAELSAETLKLDKHAQAVKKDVFGSSSPAQRSD
jgi:hypothetical protein